MTDMQGRVRILDNQVGMYDIGRIYNYVVESHFRIGWSDSLQIQGRKYSYLCSKYSEDDVKALKLLPLLDGTEFGDILKDYDLKTSVVNLSVPTNVHFAHAHDEDLVLLYYANPEWQPHFYGETVFFNPDCTQILHSTLYVPGRFMLFDAKLPHSVRPQSSVGPDYRFTIAFTYTKKEGL